MIACEHFRLFGLDTEILPSECERHPWNGWYVLSDGYRSFESGLYWHYLDHLDKNRKCRRVAKVTKKWVQKQLKRINREWRAATS
jgi:hypothetical protein